MEELQGKTAVITGGASGIGRAFADRFAAAGMKLVLADVEEPKLNAAVEELNAAGAETIGMVVDVSDADQVDALASAAVEQFGQVNVLCNNAGVGGSSLTSAPGELSLADWKWVLDVNLWGVIHGHKSFLPAMLEHGDGHIINTASMAGHAPGHNAYMASKWAVVGITEGLYQQLSSLGSTIGVSCLCPGWIRTGIAESDRNRPEWAAPSALEEPSPEAEMGAAFVRELVAGGLGPSEAADKVHDAILNKKFWVFTHPEMVAGLQGRFNAILSDSNPPIGSPLGG